MSGTGGLAEQCAGTLAKALTETGTGAMRGAEAGMGDVLELWPWVWWNVAYQVLQMLIAKQERFYQVEQMLLAEQERSCQVEQMLLAE
eukprot:CAMPEP_0172356758 /NCGR_PEP_ID=MMETSP1060-20121228/1144_1 /TAXON_ID=37318 /ORGANISM="Pseudo-nitzschia pungens, Strain cf. cingulata" /LENGTH=87 /DNA_ID=CAMNT_0013077071 /DNA_START=104 /DNA_END=365 /DNA_ORIENTATION=-